MADVLNGQKEIHIVMDIIYINLNEYITSIDIHVYIYICILHNFMYCIAKKKEKRKLLSYERIFNNLFKC